MSSAGLGLYANGGITPRPQVGGGFLSKANSFLKKTGAISKVASLASDMGVPYAGTVSKVAKKVGYGKKKKSGKGKKK